MSDLARAQSARSPSGSRPRSAGPRWPSGCRTSSPRPRPSAASPTWATSATRRATSSAASSSSATSAAGSRPRSPPRRWPRSTHATTSTPGSAGSSGSPCWAGPSTRSIAATLEVAAEVLRLGGVDEVWMMPCYEHLAGKSMAPPEQRLEMCRLAARSARGVGVFDYEIRHQFRGETYHLVKKLLARGGGPGPLRLQPRHRPGQRRRALHLDQRRGSRAAAAVHRGPPARLLRRPARRPGTCRPPHRYLEPAHQDFATSSTEVRRLLRAGDPGRETAGPGGARLHPGERAVSAGRPGRHRGSPTRKVAVFTGTFDPPTRFHRAAAEALLRDGFDEVVISPHRPRPGAEQPEHAAPRPSGRAGRPGVPRPPRRQGRPDRAGRRAVRTARGAGGPARRGPARSGTSSAPTRCRWPGRPGVDPGPLGGRRRALEAISVRRPPPAGRAARQPRTCRRPTVPSRSTGRSRPRTSGSRIYAGETVEELLTPEVAGYICRHRLFVPFVPGRALPLRCPAPRIRIVFDERNARAVEIAGRYRAIRRRRRPT